jgi:hypothetical protein
MADPMTDYFQSILNDQSPEMQRLRQQQQQELQQDYNRLTQVSGISPFDMWRLSMGYEMQRLMQELPVWMREAVRSGDPRAKRLLLEWYRQRYGPDIPDWLQLMLM